MKIDMKTKLFDSPALKLVLLVMYIYLICIFISKLPQTAKDKVYFYFTPLTKIPRYPSIPKNHGSLLFLWVGISLIIVSVRSLK